MNDNVITYLLSLLCMIFILIETISINRKKGLIDIIVFMVYSCPLYYLMFYRGYGGAAFTWWFYLLLLMFIHLVLVAFRIAKIIVNKLTKQISNKMKKIYIFLVIAIVISSIIGYMVGFPSNKKLESQLDGYWNLVVDSLVIKRNAKVGFETLNFCFSSETVKLPLIQIPQIDFKGKTLLDTDIDNDSLDKYESLYQKAECESHGIWKLSSTKDSINIQAVSHPLNGSNKLCFFKTHFLGKEHYFMRMSNDSTYIVCEKCFSGNVNWKLLKEWDR